MTKRHCERKKTGREPKSNGQVLYVPPPPLLSRRTIHQPETALGGNGSLSIGYHFAITRPR